MRTPQQFYKELGAEGLAKRKEKVHTKKELSYLEKVLNKKQRILDLACGYGRFTIPLAKKGYKIQGLDLAPNLLKKAKEEAKKEKLKINFIEGDMRKLPYTEESFDAIICMWAAFIELTKEKDQTKAVKEMLRVLHKNGFAFIEIPAPQRLFKRLETKRKDVKPQKIRGRVVESLVEGVLGTPMYLHNKTTIEKVIKRANPRKYRISVEDFGGRPRTLVWIWK